MFCRLILHPSSPRMSGYQTLVTFFGWAALSKHVQMSFCPFGHDVSDRMAPSWSEFYTVMNSEEESWLCFMSFFNEQHEDCQSMWEGGNSSCRVLHSNCWVINRKYQQTQGMDVCVCVEHGVPVRHEPKQPVCSTTVFLSGTIFISWMGIKVIILLNRT